MLLHISQHSAETLQEQIISQLRARILTGELVANQALPSIRALARDLRVSVITVQRAYDQLLNQKLIFARRGKGFFVSALKQTDKSKLAAQRFSDQLQELVESARRDGLTDVEIEKLFTACVASEMPEEAIGATGDGDENDKTEN